MDLISDSEIEENDEIVNCDDFKIVVDGVSVMYVIGTTLDYETNLIGSQFTFKNPQAKAKCGCGTSFGV